MNTSITRAKLEVVQRSLRRSPAVSLRGVRQCGKTTLAKLLGGSYFDLEEEADHVRLDANWDAAINGQQLVILDEAHAFPKVFPRLRGAIDEDRKRNGRFLLLTSISPVLMRNVTQSLAGRIALVDLTPFLYQELPPEAAQRLWLMGGYPTGGVLAPKEFGHWQRDYLTTLAERDLPAWGFPAKPNTTMSLFTILASAHGAIWNASHVGSSLGLSYNTINSYVNFLEGAYLTRMLLPFATSGRRRNFKRPKFYWRDSGLLHSLLNVTSMEQLRSNLQAGRSWEGYVIEQILGALAATGRNPFPYYWHTSQDEREIDLVLDIAHEKWAVKSILSENPDPSFFASLDAAADIIGAKRRFLVSPTEEVVEAGDKVSCNLSWLTAKIMAQEL